MCQKLTTIQATLATRDLIKATAKKEKRTIYGLVELMIEERIKTKHDGAIQIPQTETIIQKKGG